MNKPLLLPLAGRFILLAFVISLTSCSGTKKLGGEARKDNSELVLRKINAQQIRAGWFEGNARISYDDGTQSLKFNATLRMQQDSTVWVAVKKLGFEVARALLRTDSLFIIDRLNNEYRTYALATLSDQYQLPPSLPLLQHLILGNPVFFSRGPGQVKTEGTTLTLEENSNAGLLRYNLHAEDYRPRQIAFRNSQGSGELSMTLEDYQGTPDKQKFSYLRTLTLNSQETGKINVELKFSEVELNVPKSLPFDIPGRYLRVQ